MKILLTSLNSKYIHSNLAIRYLYSVGVENCPDMTLREFSINNTDDYIYSEIIAGGFDAVCFSCYVWNIEKTKYLCENLKKAKPEMKICMGGPEVSFECKKFMEENPYVDIIFYGEGEGSFYLFTSALSYGNPELKDIRGISYRKDNTVYVNEPMPLLPFDAIPFPYEMLPLDNDKISYYESVRGCPYGCSYCMSSIEKNVRARNILKVKEELKYFIYKGVKQVKFIDRTFNWDDERACEILDFLIKYDNGITNFHFELCAKLLSDKFLKLAEKARKGLFQFEIGIQSTNLLTLKAVNRKENPEESLKKIKRLCNLGNSHIHVDLIAGLPFETFNSFRVSFNNIYQLGADNIQVGFLKLLKGTEIRENEKAYEYKYRQNAPYEFVSNRFLSAEDTIKIKRLENVLDLYYNRGGFENSIEALLKALNVTPFDFYMIFSDFYYENGYQHANHAKRDLYGILIKFTKHIRGNLGSSYKNINECIKNDMLVKFDLKTYEKVAGEEGNDKRI